MDSEIHHFKLDEGEAKSQSRADDRKEQSHEKSAQIQGSKEPQHEQGAKEKDKVKEDTNKKQGFSSTSSKPAASHRSKGKESSSDRAELSWQGRESPETAAASSLSHIETVDSWIERDSRLIPLSAAIPFNAEPDASLLFGEKENGITPASVHYVRNHGPVPRVDLDTFKLEIQLEAKPSPEESNKQPEAKDRSNETKDSADKKEKRIERSHAWTFQELKTTFKPKSVLATLCCDGLRRKELNLEEHSKGFDTGPASVGTSVYTGISLRQLVWKSLNSGDDKEADDMEEFFSQLPPFINIEGMDEPTLGHYGTSIPTAYGLNASSEVMLAYQQNGADLLPDHGAPLRLVVPGYVGGRWIKWVNKISFSHELSDSRYHHEDNRLYPSSVTLNALNSGQYFGKQHPEYTIYELNTNSVITKPSHEEEVQISFSEPGTQDNGVTEIEFAGYAYSGGGRRIHYVELSYDGGKSWKEAKVRHLDTKPEEEHKDGRGSKESHKNDQKKDEAEEADWPQYSATDNWARRRKVWSWALWSLKVTVLDLIRCEEVMVRAVDEGSNGQRKELIWNATGMMNNAYYTLKLSQRKVEKLNLANPTQRPPSQLYFAFAHPAQAGLAAGGWQAVKRRQTHAPTQQLHDMSRAGPLVGLAAHKAHKLLSASEIEEHRSADDLWIVMDQQVFDVSAYAKYHPGGVHALLAASKIPPAELSQWFRSIHGRDAEEIKTWYAIGVIAADETIEAFHALAKQRADKQQTQFISLLHDDDVGSEDNGLKLNFPTRKDGHKMPHRRPNWHESLVQRSGNKRLPQIASTPSEPSQFLLHSSRWCPIVLAHSKQLTHDSYVFTFEAAEEVRDKYAYLGIMTGQHLLIGAEINKEWVVRPYTPIWPCAYEEERMSDGDSEPGEQNRLPEKKLEHSKSSDSSAATKSQSPPLHPASLGEATDKAIQSTPPDSAQVRFQLLVKIYRQQHLMPGGVMSQFLERVALDKAKDKALNSLKVKGPTGCILYEGEGCFNIHTIGVQAKQINLIGAGTGITPLYQLVRAILLLGGEAERQANVQIRLVFSNKSMQDILLLRELHELEKRCGDRFKVCFCVTKPFREEAANKDNKQKEESQDNDKDTSKEKEADRDKDHDKDHDKNKKNDQEKEKQKDMEPNDNGKSGAKNEEQSSSSPPAPKIPSDIHLELGHVNPSVFRHHLFAPGSNTLTFICGPPMFIDSTNQFLLQLGFTDQQIVEF